MYLQLITDVKRKGDRVLSDHTTLCIKLNLKWLSTKQRGRTVKKIIRVNNWILQASGSNHFKAKIAKNINNIDENKQVELANLSPSEALAKFEEFIIHRLKEAAEREVGSHPNYSYIIIQKYTFIPH